MPVSYASGPRTTYSQVGIDELCDIVRTVLNTLPDAGETLVIGSLRARGIHVQRRRIRDAIMKVDPLNRQLRKTTTVIRRVYNVASPNSLWYDSLLGLCIKSRSKVSDGIDFFGRLGGGL